VTAEPTDSLIEFPCDFPIKIMGRADQELESIVRTLVCETLHPDRFIASRSTTSSAGRFVSVTATVRVEDKLELDAVYTVLTAHAQVLMVL
jgi:uncharacterized protein